MSDKAIRPTSEKEIINFGDATELSAAARLALELHQSADNPACSLIMTRLAIDSARYRANGILPADFQIAGLTDTKLQKHTAYKQRASKELATMPERLENNAHGNATQSGDVSNTNSGRGYAEQPIEAANGQNIAGHWNPSKGDLSLLDPSSLSKLQMYAGDMGRANGWDQDHDGTFPRVHALRHTLSAAYITYRYSPSLAILSGDWHEIQTGASDVYPQKIPWSTKPKDIQTWKDHDIDLNNNLVGAKIAQEIRENGESWQDVEQAVVDAVKHMGTSGRILQPNVTLHNFLNQP